MTLVAPGPAVPPGPLRPAPAPRLHQVRPLRRIEPVVPLLLGLHGLATTAVQDVPVPAAVAFGVVVLAGLAGLAGWCSPSAVVVRAALCTGVAFAVQVADPALVGAMLHWYYAVVAVYALLLRGPAGVAVGPLVAGCLVLQVALGSQPAPLTVAVLRAAVIAALGTLMWMAGRSYRAQHEEAEAGRAAAEAASTRLAHAATHDELTGLPNRAHLRAHLEHALAASPPGGVGVLILDVDRFKSVNDSFGHDAGDELLVQLADRLSALVGDAGLVARLGGDELAVVVLGPPSRAQDVAARVAAGFREPCRVRGREHAATVSVGVAHDSSGLSTPTELLRAADVALYRAKETGRDRWVAYDAAMTEAARERNTLEQHLRRDLKERRVDLVLQPVVDVASQRVVGVEALARWTSRGRPVPPTTFVPLAEETGLVGLLGAAVLERAVETVSRWHHDGLFDGYVAVNVSPVQIDREFIGLVRRLLDEHGLPARSLVLEITESAVADEPPWDALDALAATGVRLAIDDFGTGYSSLARLQRVPAALLKIDRSLVSAAAADDTFLRLATGLAAELGMETVAEGVETVDALEVVRRAGCDRVQGFLFSAGLPEQELLALLGPGQVVETAAPA